MLNHDLLTMQEAIDNVTNQNIINQKPSFWVRFLSCIGLQRFFSKPRLRLRLSEILGSK